MNGPLYDVRGSLFSSMVLFITRLRLTKFGFIFRILALAFRRKYLGVVAYILTAFR